MVKIRLRRIGTKGRPFYRVVVAPSMAGRNGRFVETLGTYDPTVKPTRVQINEERAMHWLLNGAQPTETAAYLLNKTGILGRYLEQRPEKKKDFKFLDKTTAAISKPTAVDTQAGAPAAEAPVAPVAETPATPAPASEAPAAAGDETVTEATDSPAAEATETATEE